MKQRIISGIIGILLLLVVLFLRDTLVFNILAALVLILAVVESQFSTKMVDSGVLVLLGCFYAAASAFFPIFGFFPLGGIITVLYIFAAMVAAVMNNERIKAITLFYSVSVTLLITAGINSILYLNSLYLLENNGYASVDSLFLILVVFIGAWFGDAGAYFIGSKFGKNKIAPVISPKKTVGGLFGGIVSTVLGMLLLGLIWNFWVLREEADVRFVALAIVAALCSVIGFIGDLFFSYIKRSAGIKDFGKIMPGHGGVLDRMDSLIFIAPFVYLTILYFPLIVRG